MLTGILILNLAISLALVTVIFSFLNTGYQNISAGVEQSKNRIVVDLRTPVSVKSLPDLEKKWNEVPSLQWTYLLSNEDYVQTNGASGLYHVFGVNKDFKLQKELPVDQIGQDEVVISRNAADKMFLGLQEEDIIGQTIQIADKQLMITAIDQSSLVENVYISIENFFELYGNKTNVVMGVFIFGQTSVETVQAKVLPTLTSYKPSISKQSPEAERLGQFYSLLILAIVITAGLMLYVVLNFIYIFSFKISKDKNKWDILMKLGASRKVLKRAIYAESGFVVIVASLLSAVFTFLVSKYVDIEGFQLKLNLPVFIILIFTVICIIVITVEQTLKKIWNNLFKGAGT
ncbi:ABC transporter permease [Paenibacillus sp. FSL R7-0198]|uniref:ABC transporter permease n=1 Tax=Paenibacillus sp. FSL R7-0198 TaxID=2921674 RepID=UPI0030F66ACA